MRNPAFSSTSTPHHRSIAANNAAAGAGGAAGLSSSPSPSPSSMVPNKATPCCTKVGLKRGPWTPEEDLLLSNYIKKEGEGKWRTLPKKAGLLRCGKSCRLRWMNYLRPSVKRGHIAPDEEDLILRLHRLLGNRWSLIAGRIPGRTDNEIKNYWNTHLSKKLISQGIDPRTHKPLEPNHHPSSIVSKSSSSCEGTDDHILVDHPNSADTNTFAPFPFLEEDAAAIGGNIPHDNQFLPSAEMIAGKGSEMNMQNADGGGAHDAYGMMSIGEGLNNEDDHEDINFCSDDIFSSFLNSLITEDVFNTQNLVQQEHDDLIPASTPLFTFGPGWEAPVTACKSSLDHENDSESPNERNDN